MGRRDYAWDNTRRLAGRLILLTDLGALAGASPLALRLWLCRNTLPFEILGDRAPNGLRLRNPDAGLQRFQSGQ
jgi:hypothetical protein